jgi:bifunctional N-acetylglucosamine-1-phosphate-uridyltransferase/glucosamine-1-phosphate-acetyltransferase GlmU-like protein
VVVRTEARLAEIGRGARVGPFAVLEAGSRVAPGVVTGPFFRGRSATDGLAGVEPGGS